MQSHTVANFSNHGLSLTNTYVSEGDAIWGIELLRESAYGLLGQFLRTSSSLWYGDRELYQYDE